VKIDLCSWKQRRQFIFLAALIFCTETLLPSMFSQAGEHNSADPTTGAAFVNHDEAPGPPDG